MSNRFAGLDRLKAIALWAMLLHHTMMWMVGDARSKLGGDDGLAVTDLAAPMFAVAVGAGAELLARRLRSRGGAAVGRAIVRWVAIGAWGIALGAVIDHRVDSVGVLETMAACGAAVMAVALVASPSTGVWAAVAVALTAVSLPVIHAADAAGGWWQQAFGDSFPIVSYLAMAAAGAAVSARLGASEHQPVLDRLALAGLVGLSVLVVAGAGVWPAARYPGGPAFVVPGVVATVAVWAVAARVPAGAVARALERAGRRTLLVYVAHYSLRVALDAGGWWASLRGAGWTAAAVALAAAMAAASAVPWPLRRPATVPSGEERERDVELVGP
jgi:hypothetical protein